MVMSNKAQHFRDTERQKQSGELAVVLKLVDSLVVSLCCIEPLKYQSVFVYLMFRCNLRMFMSLFIHPTSTGTHLNHLNYTNELESVCCLQPK